MKTFTTAVLFKLPYDTKYIRLQSGNRSQSSLILFCVVQTGWHMAEQGLNFILFFAKTRIWNLSSTPLPNKSRLKMASRNMAKKCGCLIRSTPVQIGKTEVSVTWSNPNKIFPFRGENIFSALTSVEESHLSANRKYN